MRAIAIAGLLASACIIAPAAPAATMDCSGVVAPQPLQLPSTVVAPVASELATRHFQLGMPSGVLASATGASQTLDRVLLRLRIEGCRDVARALPGAPATASPNDPAAYKPQTEFDNTPWRFDMSQGGKRMTADEFDAWMKARGVRVARGAPATAPAEAVATPAAAD